MWDIIYYIKDILKKFFCKHKYKVYLGECGIQLFMVYDCPKCGKIKVKEV